MHRRETNYMSQDRLPIVSKVLKGQTKMCHCQGYAVITPIASGNYIKILAITKYQDMIIANCIQGGLAVVYSS